ncbi:MAG: cell envelope integrity protein TolA [Proteobacteria bacterium]|nr:cell envelope integrity protein TolA [Pseudomonadota bacterium]MBS0503736.1 cell envelope integrity protein TolA [Pseudomonadota bacterium]
MPGPARILLTVSGSLLAAGCAGSMPQRQSAGLPPAVIARVTADAAAQVKRCYRTPKVMGEGRRIATRLHVRYAPDGSIIGVPAVVWQTGVTPSNQMFADEMAQAAIESVVRCSPLRLPPELYAYSWNDFELTFSPAARG